MNTIRLVGWITGTSLLIQALSLADSAFRAAIIAASAATVAAVGALASRVAPDTVRSREFAVLPLVAGFITFLGLITQCGSFAGALALAALGGIAVSWTTEIASCRASGSSPRLLQYVGLAVFFIATGLLAFPVNLRWIVLVFDLAVAITSVSLAVRSSDRWIRAVAGSMFVVGCTSVLLVMCVGPRKSEVLHWLVVCLAVTVLIRGSSHGQRG